MNLLFANDQPGAYPDSWYAATATPLPPFAPLEGHHSTEVCVIGGGFTGLSAALALADAGRDVTLLDAQRVGFGASGRNGGQVGVGQRQDQHWLQRKFGAETARHLWTLSEAAKDAVTDLAARHQIDAAWKPGLAHVDWTASGAHETADYAKFLQDTYDASHIEPLNRDATRALIKSDAYHGGMIDHRAGHIHPLRFALGLAKAAMSKGAKIHERSHVTDLDIRTGQVTTETGRVAADHVILATNGYHGGLETGIAQRVLPINNFILATEPLGDRAQDVLTQDIAVADSKFVINYFRLSEDKRLLFGGGETYGDRFPKDMASIARKPMIEVFPQLKDVRIDYAWGGTLGITPTRLPYFAQLSERTWTACGYSGHGVALATLAGQMIAAALAGDRRDFDLMARLKPPAFPGLSLIRRPLLTLAMHWFALRDRFQM